MKLTRAAEMRPASFDEAQNTVEVVWTTGAAVRRYDWRSGRYYQEILEVSPKAVRLDRLNAGAPLLDTHDDSALAQVVGAVVPGSAKIADGVGIARVKLSSAAADADIVSKIRDGIIRNVSVGYAIHKVIKTDSDGDGADDEWRVVDWEPLELSAVPVPADAGAQFRSIGQDDSPAAARARMMARQNEVGISTRWRRATPEEVYQMGRSPAYVPEELWPMVGDTTHAY